MLTCKSSAKTGGRTRGAAGQRTAKRGAAARVIVEWYKNARYCEVITFAAGPGENTQDEDRSSRQYRRPAPHGEAAPAEDRLRFHRGRAGGRARAGNQHLGLSQAQIVAALSRRCLEARPVEGDLRPNLCQPIWHLADRW